MGWWYIHHLNPETVVENNPCYGLSGINTEWGCGIYYPALLSNTSVIWSEEGDEAGYTADGILVSKIRSYKMASHLKNKIGSHGIQQTVHGDDRGVLQVMNLQKKRIF
jgi:hypothetical protein